MGNKSVGNELRDKKLSENAFLQKVRAYFSDDSPKIVRPASIRRLFNDISFANMSLECRMITDCGPLTVLEAYDDYAMISTSFPRTDLHETPIIGAHPYGSAISYYLKDDQGLRQT